MKKLLSFTLIGLLAASTLTFSGCAKGEEDPFFSIHSRDARISQPWILKSMTGTIVTTINDQTTNLEYEYDGTNLYITQDGNTQVFNYIYKMDIKDNGEVFSEEFKNDFGNGSVISQSSQTSYWYWGDDKGNKTSINLDLTGIMNAWKNYDLTRLAYNDIIMSVDYSDNYTIFNEADSSYDAGSESVLLELKFDVDLTALN